MAPLRIAVAGAGYIGQAHIDAVRHTPGLELSAIVDPSAAAAGVARDAGVPLLADLDALFASARPDGVVLATPNVLHVPQAMQALAAGVPMLLEKPVAADLDGARRLQAAVRRSDVPVLVGHHRAHSPIMQAACEVVASGRLGRLVAVNGTALFLKPDHYFDDAPWRRQPGGGPVLLNMIHEVHNLRMMCGEIVAVQAFGSNATRGFAVEDTVSIGLRFASGVLGTFLLSDTAASARSWEQTSGENPAYPSYDDEDCYLVAGTHGSLAIPTMRLRTYGDGAQRSWWTPFTSGTVPVTRDDPIRRQMAHFGQVLRGHATPLVTVDDGVANLRVTDAILRATQTGAIETITTD